MTGLTGGCACGAVRYALASEPYDAGYCHCRLCQRATGAPVGAFATVPFTHFRFTAGEDAVGRFRSSDRGERTHCRECGTALTIHVTHQADEIDFSLASLDDPAAIAPGFHLFTQARIPWFDTRDSLPRHAKLRPDTRGLKPGQTEL